MWTFFEIFACLAILLAACFIAGKKIGQRRFVKAQNEMKALEKAFNQLLDQMEMVSSHNLNVLETKTQELRELLNVADKKCLYATDLMNEVEEMKRKLKEYNRTASITSPAPATQVAELKLRREFEEKFERIDEYLQNIVSRIELIELAQKDFGIKFEKLIEANRTAEEAASTFASASVAISGGGTLKEDIRSKAMLTDSDIIDRIRLRAPTNEACAQERSCERGDAPENFQSDSVLSHEPLFQAELSRNPDIDPQDYEAFKQVLELHKQGFTVPQIARRLQMSKSEIELLMKFYNLRKVV